MKDKRVAAIFAFFLGGLGIHRFYLGQVGLGILYMVFFWMFPIMFIVGLIDAIAFMAMDQKEFDLKYNRKYLREGYVRDNPRSRSTRRSRRRDARTRKKEQLPKSRTRHSSQFRKRHNPFKSSGIEKFKDYDYEGAIEDFNKALEIDGNDIAVHFNLACAFSLMEDVPKSLNHLDLAIKHGFNDFGKIKSHDALAYLRIQPEFEAFVENGYSFTQKPSASIEEKETEAEIPPEAAGDLLEQLNRLSQLRKKGLLTEEEFLLQKKKLLS